MFQYQIWKRSLDVKYIAYIAFLLVMAVLLNYFAYEMIIDQNDVLGKKAVIDALEAQTQTTAILAQIELEYAHQDHLSEHYYRNLIVVAVLNILTFGYFIQDIFELVYANLRGVFVKTFTPNLLIDFISIILVIVWLSKVFGTYSQDLDEHRSEKQTSVLVERIRTNSGFNEKAVIATLLAIQYIRFVLALQVSRTFGPMVKILGSMLVDVIIFLFLFAAILLIFAGSGGILFQELSAYTDMEESLKTLFASSIGEFDYATYDTLTDVKPRYGWIFITVFLLLIAIMLLNFLIAILSSTYSNLEEVKTGLYLRNVINLRQRYAYNRYYSSIVYAGMPTNFMVLFALPFVVSLRSRMLNKVLMIIEYLTVGIISIFLFLCGVLILLPFAYLILLFHKARLIPQKSDRGGKRNS